MTRLSSGILAAIIGAVMALPAYTQNGRTTIAPTRLIYGHGDIQPDQLTQAARRVAFMTLQHPVVRLRVGETLVLDTVVVIAYDSSRAPIGRLRAFDSRLRSGGLKPAGIRDNEAVAAGRTELIRAFPRRFWTGRAVRQPKSSCASRSHPEIADAPIPEPRRVPDECSCVPRHSVVV